ncbi:hypothetical protein BBO99_00006393 [Phytophthora kernoviae]|uniref:Glycoside hydrolase family 5 domain-containing protein n=2 Tax=Phytophthora kernoviae TaxID=325452 RepID=A0A421F467_9STRA|nr:hypothetical protein G195_009279 [Phytophthora kernoviae 00238/432]KAG2507321.1 hypothetical protein JM16_009015 [Phytophthora kernoviae]KAG2518634.1 hypothetical protein JM18_007648 [Phytophthora kernoviae]RLN21049.1 hypothetical protein BBI17_007982 [Phytophthora kernoviae]RLN77878.1 hypothetical protein BBO99_00006393 [Phytophthora kernoviae]
MKLSVTLAVLFAAFAASNVQGYTNPIKIKGYKMFDAKTGAAIAVKGIDYYPRPNTGSLDVNNYDFFTDDNEDVWKNDIEYLAEAGANAVRLYAVNPSKSHDKFMCALRAKGICTDCAITKDAYPQCYPAALKTRGEQIILAFSKYDNVLGFSAGNEVNNEVPADASINAPCQKKFIRDLRAFIGGCSSIRKIPVGVVAADPDVTKNNRAVNAKYYNCRTNASDVYENAEWYGLNTYVDCEVSATDASQATGFQNLLKDFTTLGMTIPVMLTEFGCLNQGYPTDSGYAAQRLWRHAGWLYSSAFRDVFAGGFAFEYSTENANSKSTSSYPFKTYGAQNYGLGYFSPENCDHKNTTCVYIPMPNYHNLAVQYNATNVSGESTMNVFTSTRTTLPTTILHLPQSTIEWSLDERFWLGYRQHW